MSPSAVINPGSLPRPSGFSYAVSASGERTVHFAGHTAVDGEGRIVGPGDVVAQFAQVLRNLQTTAAAAGLELSQMAKLTIYVTDVESYQGKAKEIGVIYRRIFGSHYPAMTLVPVPRLWDQQAIIEIEGVAIG
jgi:enamine deaminase RidA (YjgF/YER057c/UK114 family)